MTLLYIFFTLVFSNYGHSFILIKTEKHPRVIFIYYQNEKKVSSHIRSHVGQWVRAVFV